MSALLPGPNGVGDPHDKCRSCTHRRCEHRFGFCFGYAYAPCTCNRFAEPVSR